LRYEDSLDDLPLPSKSRDQLAVVDDLRGGAVSRLDADFLPGEESGLAILVHAAAPGTSAPSTVASIQVSPPRTNTFTTAAVYTTTTFRVSSTVPPDNVCAVTRKDCGPAGK